MVFYVQQVIQIEQFVFVLFKPALECCIMVFKPACPGILYYGIPCLIVMHYAAASSASVYLGHVQCSYCCTCSSPLTMQSCAYRICVLWNSSYTCACTIVLYMVHSLYNRNQSCTLTNATDTQHMQCLMLACVHCT